MKLVASFGFKYGRPPGEWSDLYDVRHIRNPYGLVQFTGKTGLDKDVQEFVLGHQAAQDIVNDICQQNRDYVAIGCHGGKDRSVAIAEEVGRRMGVKVCHLAQPNWPMNR